MKGLARSVRVVIGAVCGSVGPAAVLFGTDTTVVLERQVTNGVRLQVLRESVTLVSWEELDKRQPIEVVRTNYIDGKPRVVVKGYGLPPIPMREDIFYVVWIDGNRTNVNRTRYLKKVLFSRQPPWARLFDVLDEPPRTFYLHEDYPSRLAFEEDTQLVVSMVEEEQTDGRERVKIREFLVWSPTNTAALVTAARLLGSYEKGTLSVEVTIAPWGRGGILRTYTETYWFGGSRWYPRLKPPPAQRRARP